jgi:ubiquinol-cytochrome c reductase cytochrome b/c1 subunit
MMKNTIIALTLAASLAGIGAAGAAEVTHPPAQKWSFAGPFGQYDQAQLQRGFKVYKEVCASCHSMNLLAFRNLADVGGPGFSAAQAAAVAAEYKIKDLDDKGEAIERAGRPADYFPSPFANDRAAAAANGGTAPPDCSTIAKARTYERGFPWFIVDVFTQYQEQGPDYLTALIKGYGQAPAGMTMPAGMNYNKYFPGHMIGMPPPVQEGQITYDDGTKATIDQYAKDVTAFLVWAAEPHMEARKRVGLQVFIFLIVFAGLLYFTKKKVWAEAH